jgi:1,2-diacylglycerol 3-beta-glucosyltransferase
MAAQRSGSARPCAQWENKVATIASVLLSMVQCVLLFCLAYQYLLALASIKQPSVAVGSSRPCRRFAIAIPAHDEARVLPATLAQLRRQDYPIDLFDVHVVADHCSDSTAEVARRSGAAVHERYGPPKGRKAYALKWLLDRLLDEHPGYDAVAVFDADSQVASNFLQIMDGHLRTGAQVLQGQHIVSNPGDSMLAAIAAVDMRLNNRLRNQSRRNLGSSCRLMGDAMVFDAQVLRTLGWQGESLTEDREYGYQLMLNGFRVQYVPEAQSYGQAAGGWRQALPQRLRWYQGIAAMQRRLAGRLLSGALRARSAALFDGAIELLMPSYSFLLAASALNLGLVLALEATAPGAKTLLSFAGSVLLLAAWTSYPVIGLLIDRAPLWAFRALLIGPPYLIWRLWLSVLARTRGDRIDWVRTQRREEADRPG